MTSGDHAPILRYAADALRDSPVRGWVDISASAISRVRAVGIRTWPLDARYPDDDAPATDTLRISDAIVRVTLRRAVAEVQEAEPSDISLYTDGHVCTGARITVIAAYDSDLAGIGAQVSTRAAAALTDILGLKFISHDVDVLVADVDGPA